MSEIDMSGIPHYEREISRLRAALEQAERERDEARKWARRMYRLAKDLDGVLNTINGAMVLYVAGIDFPRGFGEDILGGF